MKDEIKKLILVLFLFLTTAFCFAETYFEKADSYYDKDNYSLAKIYYEYSLFNEEVANGKLFYRLGYSYEQLKIQKSIYPKLYCAAAYCFERDNDKENKYYAYAISKEKDLGINHNDYSEETIKELTEELYWKTHKKNFTYLKKKPNELIWYSIMLLVLLLMIIALIDSIIKHFSNYKYELKNINCGLSELFNSSNYVNTTPEFNNQLQNSYNNMVKNARYGCTQITNSENFLLYKFGQVVFTKKGNEVDHKTVTEGLNQIFFPETNSIESTNQKINFINKFNEFFQKWYELQIVYNEHLYESPELGVLLSVLYSKMNTDNFIKNANSVVDVCNDFEYYKINSYRHAFIVIANKIYHEKIDENDLSKKLEFELNAVTKKFSNRIKLLTEKFFELIVKFIPILLFIYVLVFLLHASSLSIFSFIVTGIGCFILYKIQSKLNNRYTPDSGFRRLITKQESEMLERTFQASKQSAGTRKQAAAQYYEKPDTDEYEDINGYQQETPKSNEKHKTTIIKYYCKYCGKWEKEPWKVANGHCDNSLSGKHVLYDGPESTKYYCEYCGKWEKELWKLTHEPCNNSPSRKHIAYEGGEKDKYYCKYCGKWEKELWKLTRRPCNNSPTGKHFPAR